jgi:2-amino-4-hydroxy-6-hydroxymethyldihydropteridine diphosphokinase
MPTIYLGLGSNLGDREANLRRALDLLGERVQVKRTSSIYETEPVGFKDQPQFLNLVCCGTTELSPRDLLAFVKSIEAVMGRLPTVRFGPRLIDIDILFYDDLVLDEADLVIPHPRLHERAFVLVPLSEIAPDLVHPVLKKTVRDLLTLVSIQLPAVSRQL